MVNWKQKQKPMVRVNHWSFFPAKSSLDLGVFGYRTHIIFAFTSHTLQFRGCLTGVLSRSLTFFGSIRARLRRRRKEEEENSRALKREIPIRTFLSNYNLNTSMYGSRTLEPGTSLMKSLVCKTDLSATAFRV